MKRINKVEVNGMLVAPPLLTWSGGDNSMIGLRMVVSNDYKRKTDKDWIRCPCFINVTWVTSEKNAKKFKERDLVHVSGKLYMDTKGDKTYPVYIKSWDVKSAEDEEVAQPSNNNHEGEDLPY